MGRARVLSFMSAFGGSPRSPTSTPSPAAMDNSQEVHRSSSPQHSAAPAEESPTPTRTRLERPASSRPMSMIQTYQPPLMEVAHDTIPELQPIFTFLNSHSNKLYQEGYFLKLNDLDTHGRPNPDRSWTECFAQLVGTVLSLWDAGALDVAGEDGEVAPTFINLADASIKMIETLPTRSQNVQPLQNVLSISTAGKNRYLLHFNSLHSLTQWTAGIRLAMFEHATLQEAYTGSLIAGKGKLLNNIKVIMERTKLKTEDWARVRFGAGTPWRRCWCVISPPSEKDIAKQQKSLKKKSAYDHSSVNLKGDIKFYDTKKIKKALPIATISDVYSAYAIYPQSKPLIDQSALVKVEGTIRIHSTPDTSTEGFVFVLPEVHPAITGFEMMLRWLFPVYDTFALYGRPNRLIADTLDVRSLMFAMPQEKRYGYLEILDVAGLIHTNGSSTWKEKEWRKQLKDLTSARITSLQGSGSRTGSRAGSRRVHRNSLPSRNGVLRFEDGASIRSSPSEHNDSDSIAPVPRTDSAPPGGGPFTPPRGIAKHQRSTSEATPATASRNHRATPGIQQEYTPSRLSYEATPSRISSDTPPPPIPRMSYEPTPPPPPAHRIPVDASQGHGVKQRYAADLEISNDRSSSESDRRYHGNRETDAQEIGEYVRPHSPPAPVVAPPAFAHEPGAKPQTRPYHSPELRRANSRMSATTLSQLADVSAGGIAAAGAAAAWKVNGQRDGRYSEDQQRGVNHDASKSGMIADHSSAYEGMVLAGAGQATLNNSHVGSYNRRGSTMPPPDVAGVHAQGLLPPSNSGSRSASPLSQTSTHSSSSDKKSFPAVARNFSRRNPTQSSSDDSRPYPPPTDSTVMNNKHEPMPIVSQSQRPHQPQRFNTNKSITRKPLPNQVKPALDPEEPEVPMRTSLDSLRQHAVDQESLDLIARLPTISSDGNDFYPRRSSDDTSYYDNESTASPDYASTRKSTETKRSVEKPRTGVLKTVGRIEPVEKEVVVGDAHYRPSAQKQQPITTDLPHIDFGPTQALNPAMVTQPAILPAQDQPWHKRSISAESFAPTALSNSHESKLIYSKDSPNDGRTPSRNAETPEPREFRSASGEPDSDRRRSVAWQPGTTIGGSPGNRQSITPEQFVQQRATTGRLTPVFAHGARQSTTPPLVSRNSSGDWSQQLGRQSPSNKDLPPRPHSRGASTIMNTREADYSAHLSAREQEYVARVTSSPLITVAGQRAAPQESGLIAAIEARERERRGIKEGLSGQMVQQAIAQRQQQAQLQAHGRQNTQGFPVPGQWPETPQGLIAPQSQYGGWGVQQNPNANRQQQQGWVSPAASLYWNTAQTQSQYQQPQYQHTQIQQHSPYQQEQYQQTGQIQQGYFSPAQQHQYFNGRGAGQ